METKIEYIWDSFKGARRSSNKDDVAIINPDSPKGNIFAIFDGVSSLTNARHGVNIAKNYLRHKISSKIHSNTTIDLKSIVVQINDKILLSKREKPFSTLAIIFFDAVSKNYATIINIGDSRVYKFTNQYIEQLTYDDKSNCDVNIITKYLGMSREIIDKIKPININIKQDESILMCTDGFYEIMNKDIIQFIVAFNKESIVKVRNDVAKLIEGKNNDDATYILIRNKNV